MVWLIVGTVSATLFTLISARRVRRVSVDAESVRVHRGPLLFASRYSRQAYRRAIRVGRAVYIAKPGGPHLINPTVSPMLTQPEARWITSELKRALGAV